MRSLQYIYSALLVGMRGNAVPTPFLPRLCLLVYFSVFYIWISNTHCDNAFPNFKCVPEPFS